MRHAAKSAGPISLDAIKVPAAAFGPGAALTYTVIEKPADKGEKRGETREERRGPRLTRGETCSRHGRRGG